MATDISAPFGAAIADAVVAANPLRRSDVYQAGPPVDAVSEEILAFVLSNAIGRVLDLGCGIGPYLGHLMGSGFNVIGVEYSHSVACQAVALGRPVMVASATEIPFSDKCFDTVVMIEALEHVPDPHAALREIVRVTRKRLIMTVPNFGAVPQLSRIQMVPWHMLSPTHVNFFTNEILASVLKQHFGRVQVSSLGHFFTVGEEPVYMHCAAVADLN